MFIQQLEIFCCNCSGHEGEVLRLVMAVWKGAIAGGMFDVNRTEVTEKDLNTKSAVGVSITAFKYKVES